MYMYIIETERAKAICIYKFHNSKSADCMQNKSVLEIVHAL